MNEFIYCLVIQNHQMVPFKRIISSISFRTMNAPIFSHKLINDGPNPGPWPEIWPETWTVARDLDPIFDLGKVKKKAESFYNIVLNFYFFIFFLNDRLRHSKTPKSFKSPGE